MNKNDTLRHLLKAKELALQGALKHLDQQFEEGQYDKNLKAKISKELAEECRHFTKKKVKKKSHYRNLTKLFMNCKTLLNQKILEIFWMQ